MAFYEYTFLVRADFSKNQIDDLIEKIGKVTKEFKGSVTKHEYWGLRHLAYKVKKNKKAHYCFFNLDISPEGMKELQRQASVNENILRTLVIKVDELDPNPSPMMNQKPKNYYNSDDKPKYNSDDKPKYNSDDKPKYNSDDKPKYNSDDKPKYNSDDKPKSTSPVAPSAS